MERDVQKEKKAICPTCGDNPSAACVDGNFRLPRLEFRGMLIVILHSFTKQSNRNLILKIWRFVTEK